MALTVADANRIARELDAQLNAPGVSAGALRTVVSDGRRSMQHTLTVESVREMRRLRAGGWSPQALAARFGVSVSQVRAVCARRAWKDVA